MPPYKEQGIVLRSMKLGEADKIVTILTQGSGKVRAVAKGLRKTTSRFGGRLEPFTHVNLMLYRGRGALDTVTQVEILAAAPTDPRRPLAVRGRRDDGRGGRQGRRGARAQRPARRCSCSTGCAPSTPGRATRRRWPSPSWLKLLSLSGFHPALTACAVCGAPDVRLWSAGLGGAVCPRCADAERRRASRPRRSPCSRRSPAPTCRWSAVATRPTRAGPTEARGMLVGFTEYHLERRMRSVPMLVRTAR